jgi:hypothetical protein
MHSPVRALPLGLTLLIGCNDGLAPIPQPTRCPQPFIGICGTVTFRATLPDSTAGLFVVAYPAFPESLRALLTFQPLLPPRLALPALGDSTTVYALGLPNGVYQWVLAVWQKQGTLKADFSNADSLFKEAGFYRDHADTTAHGSGIVVVNSTGTDSIDFVVDFRNMHSISYYFPGPRSP